MRAGIHNVIIVDPALVAVQRDSFQVKGRCSCFLQFVGRLSVTYQQLNDSRNDHALYFATYATLCTSIPTNGKRRLCSLLATHYKNLVAQLNTVKLIWNFNLNIQSVNAQLCHLYICLFLFISPSSSTSCFLNVSFLVYLPAFLLPRVFLSHLATFLSTVP